MYYSVLEEDLSYWTCNKSVCDCVSCVMDDKILLQFAMSMKLRFWLRPDEGIF